MAGRNPPRSSATRRALRIEIDGHAQTTTASFADAVSHMVYDHNLYIRCELVRLGRLLETVREDFEQESISIDRLLLAFAELRDVFLSALEFEEETLFPMLARLDEIAAIDPPECAALDAAVRRQLEEYRRGLSLLAAIGESMLACCPPQPLPLLFSCLQYDLGAFDEELRRRTELKEDFLLHAAIELGRSASRKPARRADAERPGAPFYRHA